MRQGLCSLRATPDLRGRIPLTSADGPSPRRESVGRSGTGAPYSAALRVVGAPRMPAVSPRNMTLPLRSIELPTRAPLNRAPMPSARSTTARPATRARADPAATAMSTGARAVAAPSASFGAAAGAGSVASRSSLANAPCSSLALAKTPGARRLWAGACRRGTGVAGGVRVQPALQRPRDPRGAARPGRHEPAEPIVGTLRVGQQRAGSGGTATRGAAGTAASITTAGSRRGKAHGGATAGHAGRAWVVKRAMPVLPIG